MADEGLTGEGREEGRGSCAGEGSETAVDGGAGDSVARESAEGFGKRNRSGPARASTNCPHMRFHPFARTPTPAAIYCSHSAGSQHKYVTPMAAPISRRVREFFRCRPRGKNVRDRRRWMFSGMGDESPLFVEFSALRSRARNSRSGADLRALSILIR